ncbi:helix-turn-helix domain-containing protein [Aureimonas sp. SK2]|uniref:helix-turn-helix domain-containing protein n=1 Tax=Aureimonas sp. SK2 TaxID=3015992 RepID=UPI00244426C2|nr:helix-turn-helix domain-containing protein [Aureimonas sp. SK2]
MSGSEKEAWDRFRIKAEVQRRGSTLTEIATKAGIAESSCRMALTGGSRKGAQALSKFLGVPLTVLFPGLYLRPRLTRREPIAKAASESRQKRSQAAPADRASA